MARSLHTKNSTKVVLPFNVTLGDSHAPSSLCLICGDRLSNERSGAIACKVNVTTSISAIQGAMQTERTEAVISLHAALIRRSNAGGERSSYSCVQSWIYIIAAVRPVFNFFQFAASTLILVVVLTLYVIAIKV